MNTDVANFRLYIFTNSRLALPNLVGRPGLAPGLPANQAGVLLLNYQPIWCPRQDSNPVRRVRGAPCFTLHYKGPNSLLHDTPKNKNPMLRFRCMGFLLVRLKTGLHQDSHAQAYPFTLRFEGIAHRIGRGQWGARMLSSQPPADALAIMKLRPERCHLN